MRYRSVLADVIWPAITAPTAANKLALLFQLEHSQWWSPEKLLEAQFRQLNRLLPYAHRNVPYYSRTLRGISGLERIVPERWREVPILSRKDLYQAKQELLSRRVPREHGRQIPTMTSGSTGMPVEVVGTDVTSLFWQVFCLRDHFWHQRDLEAKLFAIRYVRGESKEKMQGARAQGWGSATDDLMHTGPAVLYDILQDIPVLAERVTEERPAYLLSHPSVLAGLIDHCRRHAMRPQGLREIRSVGESLPESLRALCLEAWGVPLVDMYTCQEAGYLALQCPEHEHYHVQSENILLEVLDGNGQACRPGEVGRVVITSLNNFATPLIRYELGDYAEVGEPCGCGRGLPVLKRIMGRYRNLLTLPSGEQRWPRLGYESKLQEIAPIELMQMVQHSLENIEVRLVMPRPLTEEEGQRLTSFIHRNLGYAFTLDFNYVESIRNSSNGKLEQFISKIHSEHRH